MIPLLVALLGAILYRLRGLDNKVARTIGLVGWSLSLGAACLLFAPWWVGILVAVGSAAMVSRGHGDWQDWGHSHLSDPDEWLNPIVHRLTSERDGPAHDALGMALSGMATTLPLAIALFVYRPLAGFLLLLAGLLKALAYAIGWWIFGIFGRDAGPRHLKAGTEMGEALTGALLFGTGAGIILYLSQ